MEELHKPCAARWKWRPPVTALLLPGAGGITSATDAGLYAVDRFGAVRELWREGQPLLGKTVKAFQVLKAVSVSAGAARSFSATGGIVALVTFTDATTAIGQVDMP